ncbi:MAG: GNAT family N-acetyltransferase [Chloroflexota bacterium]
MTEARIAVRAFRPDDADAVAQAIVDSSIHHVSLEPKRYEVLDAAKVAAMYRAGTQHPAGVRSIERATLVAELDGSVVGVVDTHVVFPEGAHQRFRYGLLAEVAVVAGARRHGVGEALVRAAEAWARERDCVYTVLDYNAYNDDAGRFYRDRLGYQSAGMIVVKDLREAPPD